MGTYGLSIKELVEAMAEALDGLEGDFSNDTLAQALTKMHQYPYTSNSRRSEKEWQKYLEALE